MGPESSREIITGDVNHWIKTVTPKEKSVKVKKSLWLRLLKKPKRIAPEIKIVHPEKEITDPRTRIDGIIEEQMTDVVMTDVVMTDVVMTDVVMIGAVMIGAVMTDVVMEVKEEAQRPPQKGSLKEMINHGSILTWMEWSKGKASWK